MAAIMRKSVALVALPMSLMAVVNVVAAPARVGRLDSIQINGWPNSMKPEHNKPLRLTIGLRNTSTASVGPFELEIQPFAARHDISQPLSGISLLPHEATARIVTVLPDQTGPVEVLVRLRSGTTGDVRFEKIGVIEVVDVPTFFERHRALLTIAGPIASALIVAFVTVAIQFVLFQGGRRQKAHETVAQIVSEQARDYYSAILGATGELARSLQQVSKTTGSDREHFIRRAFFFFGLFLYKESEFAFRGGFFYLPHLWAEDVVAKLLTEISEQIKLPLGHEAVIHKCFSDLGRIRAGWDKDDPTIKFKVRTFRDLDEVLQKPRDQMTADEVGLHAALEAAAPQLMDSMVIDRIRVVERALRAVITYEFTKVFSHWYRGGNANRTLPKTLPKDFDGISGDVADWNAVRRIVT
jgi:hypothetical protein